MNVNKPFSLLDLLASDYDILSWSEQQPGKHSIYWEDENKEYQYYVITTEGLRSLHEHLPEVVESLRNENGDVKGKLLQTTWRSHWRYQNHDVDPTNKNKNPDTPPWKLERLLKVRRETSREDSILTRVRMYKVATTPSGIEYAAEQVVTNLTWRTSWLDLHFKDGVQLFQACAAMGLGIEETGAYIQTQYLPYSVTGLAPLTPPDNIVLE